MRKEIIVAIVFGVILGLIVAIVMVLRVRQTGGQNLLGGNQVTPSVSAINAQLQPLEVTSPAQDSIVGSDEVTIKGKALKDSLIIVESPIDDLSVKNAKEDFSIDFPLSLGENVISITVYPKDVKLNSQTKILRVYYLTE